MSFSELSASIINQFASTGTTPPVGGPSRDRSKDLLSARTPDPGLLVGKAIISFANIERMTMPEGWLETRFKLGSLGQRVFRQYAACQNSDVAMYMRISEQALDVQARLLLLQIVQLASPSESWARMLPAVNYFGCMGEVRDLILLAARSGDINGKRALLIEGTSHTLQKNMYCLLFDTEGSGRYPLEICYHAPKDEYLNHLRDVIAALKTIEWK